MRDQYRADFELYLLLWEEVHFFVFLKGLGVSGNGLPLVLLLASQCLCGRNWCLQWKGQLTFDQLLNQNGQLLLSSLIWLSCCSIAVVWNSSSKLSDIWVPIFLLFDCRFVAWYLELIFHRADFGLLCLSDKPSKNNLCCFA